MTTITLDIAAFREAIPAFASETEYPDSLITQYWTVYKKALRVANFTDEYLKYLKYLKPIFSPR